MDVLVKDLKNGEFFATADQPPNNVFIMLVPPTATETGLCQNINDETYWRIDGNRFVRRIREDEYDKKIFHV